MITDAKQKEKDETKSNNTPNKTHKKGTDNSITRHTRPKVPDVLLSRARTHCPSGLKNCHSFLDKIQI